jgi:hypothetical protein
MHIRRGYRSRCGFRTTSFGLFGIRHTLLHATARRLGRGSRRRSGRPMAFPRGVMVVRRTTTTRVVAASFTPPTTPFRLRPFPCRGVRIGRRSPGRSAMTPWCAVSSTTPTAAAPVLPASGRRGPPAGGSGGTGGFRIVRSGWGQCGCHGRRDHGRTHDWRCRGGHRGLGPREDRLSFLDGWCRGGMRRGWAPFRTVRMRRLLQTAFGWLLLLQCLHGRFQGFNLTGPSVLLIGLLLLL